MAVILGYEYSLVPLVIGFGGVLEPSSVLDGDGLADGRHGTTAF